MCHCCMCFQPSLFLSAAQEHFLMTDTITASMSANRMARLLEGKMGKYGNSMKECLGVQSIGFLSMSSV